MIDTRDMTLGLEYLEMLYQMTGLEYGVLRIPTGYQVTLDGICCTASRLHDAATQVTREYLRWQKAPATKEAS